MASKKKKSSKSKGSSYKFKYFKTTPIDQLVNSEKLCVRIFNHYVKMLDYAGDTYGIVPTKNDQIIHLSYNLEYALNHKMHSFNPIENEYFYRYFIDEFVESLAIRVWNLYYNAINSVDGKKAERIANEEYEKFRKHFN